MADDGREDSALPDGHDDGPEHAHVGESEALYDEGGAGGDEGADDAGDGGGADFDGGDAGGDAGGEVGAAGGYDDASADAGGGEHWPQHTHPDAGAFVSGAQPPPHFDPAQDGGDDAGYDYGGGAGGGEDAGAPSMLEPLVAPADAGFDMDVGDGRHETLDILTSVPAFANAENRALNERLIRTQRALVAAHNDGTAHHERLGVMSEHLKNVRAELAHAQELYEARRKEQASEDHLKQLTERAVGRMRAEISSLDGRADSIQAQLSSVQAAIYRGSERLEAFRASMHMKQEALDQWVAAAKAKEEDHAALEAYTRADEARIRDMTRELERVTTSISGRKGELDAAVAETRSRQLELDKVAADFRALHAERQALLRQWQEGLHTIQTRDADIAGAAGKFAALKQSVGARRARIADAAAFLARAETENSEMEARLEGARRAVGAQRAALQSATDRVNSFRDDVDLLKAEVASAASERMQQRAANAVFAQQLADKERALEGAKRALEAMRARLTDAGSAAAMTEAGLGEQEAFMKAEQARATKAERELAVLKEALFKAREAAHSLKEEESGILSDMTGARRAAKNLGDRIRELDSQAMAQQEHVYAAEFQIQQMERKIARARGDVSDEEKAALLRRIEELQAEAAEAATTERALQAQVKAAGVELMAAGRSIAGLSEQLAAVQSRIAEVGLLNRSTEDLLRKASKERGEAMVAHDVLKLEVRKLRNALSARTDEVFSLENRSSQLEMTVDARKRELEAARAVQRASVKLLEEERHRLAVDLTDRQSKIGVLKVKFEALVARLRTSVVGDDDEDDVGGMDAGGGGEDGRGGRSQAYYILKAAQKRDRLQREGDELDAAIRKGEREVRALTGTLAHLNARNTVLREAFQRVVPASDEASTVRGLEAQARDAQDALFRKRRELVAAQTEIDEAVRRHAALQDRIAALDAHIAQLGTTQERVAADRDAQGVAVAGAQTRVDAARLRHRQGGSARPIPASLLTRLGAAATAGPGGLPPTADEVSFTAQGIKECNASVLYTLGQLAREFAQLKADLSAGMAQLHIKMPARPPSRVPGSSVTAASAPVGATEVALAAAATAGGVRRASAGVATDAAASSSSRAGPPSTPQQQQQPAQARQQGVGGSGGRPTSGISLRSAGGASVGSVGSGGSQQHQGSARGLVGGDAMTSSSRRTGGGFGGAGAASGSARAGTAASSQSQGSVGGPGTAGLSFGVSGSRVG